MRKIEKAFQAIHRTDFLPGEAKYSAQVDLPIAIGYGQTNSQPTTVRYMLEWLDPRKGEKILDVGSGSGWTTALLAYLVGPKGIVYAVEKIPELLKYGAENCGRIGVQNAHFFQAHTLPGLPQFAPYDRILVSASARTLPQELIDQLKVGGRMVIPIGDSIHIINKISPKIHENIEHPGFIFVPLV